MPGGLQATFETGILTPEGGDPVVAVPEAEVVPAGGSQRRRYILPDGRQVLATRREVERLLEQFMEPEVKKTKKQKKAAVVEAMGLIDLKPAIIQVKLPPQYVFKPAPKTYEEALRAIQRRMDDEEAILLLI
jgi:ABC-type antimicrobial peptide transport system ATPase subunit